MSFKQTSSFDEAQWIINIRRTLEEELRSDDTDIPVCIFSVPKMLLATDPDSYTPQEVAIGPYHHWRPELYEMERYKLAAARRTQKLLRNGDHKFECVVDEFKKVELHIRGCYHRFLNFSDETLAWMMVIDAAFLLEFLRMYAIREGKLSEKSCSRSMSHLLDYGGTKAAHNAILRDMVMLENQIPMLVLRKLLRVQHSSMELADDALQAMLKGLRAELWPFQMAKDAPTVNVSECVHLLDYLYDTIVPRTEQQNLEAITDELKVEEDEGNVDRKQPKRRCSGDPIYVKKLFSLIWGKLLFPILSKLLFPILSKLFGSRPFQVFFKLAEPVQNLLFPSKNDKEKSDDNTSNLNKPPSLEEIAIPSVTELANSRVCFSATVGDISTARFDPKTATLHLPIISFDVNTGVIMRNLVAYEASNVSGPLVFTRYTEFINGIIDAEEDVKLLREKGIIINRLKSDAEVASLLNGMSKSIRLTKVPHIDQVIEGVNKYYNSQSKVKFRKNMKRYVFGSWQILTLVAAMILLFMTALQAFCSVYNCRRWNLFGSSSSSV